MIVTVKKQLQRATRRMVAVAAVLAIMVAALAFPFTEVTPPAQAQTAPAQPQNPDLDLNKCGASVAFVVDLSNSLS